MAKVRIPGWWLAVGAEKATGIQEIFARVMEDLPMPHGRLAADLKVDPSTVWRWKKRQGAPSLRTMLKVVGKVRGELQRQLERVSLTQEALSLVSDIEKAQDAGGRWEATLGEVSKLNKLLTKLEGLD